MSELWRKESWWREGSQSAERGQAVSEVQGSCDDGARLKFYEVELWFALLLLVLDAAYSR
jgi:hypothetical protein